MLVGAVFDHWKMMPARQCEQFIHIRHRTVEVNNDDGTVAR